MKGLKIAIIVILAGIMCFCGAKLILIDRDLSEASGKYEDLAARVTTPKPERSPGFEDTAQSVTDTAGQEELDARRVRAELQETYGFLPERNPDYVGWLSIDGTVIDYPVVQTPKDPNHYLYLDFDGEYSVSGIPFMDSECGVYPASDNTIIYAHNMKNGSMFGSLKLYSDEKYYEEHKYITFNTMYEYGTYEIIAVFRSSVDGDENGFRYYEWTEFKDEAEFDSYISSISAMALYDTGVTAEYGDRLLTLSTCSSHTDQGRFAVLARKIG